MGKTPSGCGMETLIKIVFMVQGIVLATHGVIALVAYDKHEVDETKLRNKALLITGLACFQLLASFVCFCRPCERYIYKPFVAFMLFCLCTIGLVIYQIIEAYEYEKTVSPTVLSSMILTGIYILLVIGQSIFHVVKICRFRTIKEKTDALLQES